MITREMLRRIGLLQKFVVLLLLAWAPHMVAIVYPGSPTSGSIFIGKFKCSVEKNLRVTFRSWPNDAYLESWPATTGDTCRQAYSMTPGSTLLDMAPGVTTTNSCNENELGFKATLDPTNMTISGQMTLDSTCASSTLTMTRQIGYEISQASGLGFVANDYIADYTNLSTCTGASNAYQYSRAVFRQGLCNCDPGTEGCIMHKGGTEVTLPGSSDIWAFTVPAGTSNFAVNVKGDDTDIPAQSGGTKIFPYPLGLTFDRNASDGTLDPVSSYTMWFTSPQVPAPTQKSGDKTLSTESVAGTRVLLEFGPVKVNCTIIGTNTIGGSCEITPKSLPEDLEVYVSLRPPNGDTTEYRSLVTYSYYMWQNCTELYPVDVSSENQCKYGCCPYDSALALTAVQFWARQQTVLGLYTSKVLMQTYGLTSEEAGVPFYRWQAAWNKGLQSVGGWNTDWSGYWALAFNFLDKNGDGYISESEYQDGLGEEVGVCPSGYMQSGPIVMSCNAIRGEVIFSLQDAEANNTVTIPAGVENLTFRFSSTATIDLRIEDADPSASPRKVVDTTGGAVISQNNQIASWGGVNITFMFGVDNTTNRNYYSVQFDGTLEKAIIARPIYVLATTTGVYGTYDFSTDGVANCSTDSIYKNACVAYDDSAAALAVQVWSSKLSGYASSDAAWESTVNYRLLQFGERSPFIARGMFNQYWLTLFSSRRLLMDLELQADVQSSNPGDEYEFESSRARRLAASQSLQGSALQAFRYADTNNDGLLSKAEFIKIYSSVLTCASTEYQAAMMLLNCNPLEATTVVTIERDVSLPIVIVPPGMIGFRLTASSSLDMTISMTSDEMTASPSTFSTQMPQTAATSNIAHIGSTSTNFTAVVTTQGGSNKSIELTLQGTTGGKTTWLITNNDTSTGTITLNYTFSSLSNCPSTPSGCLPFNTSYGNTLLEAWSARVSGPYGYTTSAAAWNDFAIPSRLLFNSIPLWTFPKVWCNDTLIAAGCPDWQIGFRAMDVNNDLLISLSEVNVAFALASADALDVSALTDGCSITTRYQQTEFPISRMANIESCHCSTKLAEGWDNEQQECMKRRVTACSQCTHQEKCARITTYIGSGLQEFLGDCPRNAPQNQCSVAETVSFAYPVSLAIDEEDNIYISDHGNNRIRMVNVATDLVLTIAGTGEVGFSGDGGDGAMAKLRHPEGIAVNHLRAPASYGAAQCSSPQPRRVYFSDFYNQRVRVLEKDSATGVFIISTLVGTGVRGENPDCDAGCFARDAILNNPRALALTRWGDLYIVDSGNRKIRLLSADGNVSTFLGSGSTYHSNNILAMRMKGGALLAGSWEEDNLDVYLNSVYTIQLDKEDNLWVVDGTNNRLLMAPLHSSKLNHTRGYIGRYAAYFKLHYGQLKDEETMLQNMAQWLKYEEVNGKILYVGGTQPEQLRRGQRQAGRASWKYVHPEPGDWCEPTTRPDRCLKTEAQFTRFQRTMGLCFDAGNSMFVVDQRASQVMKISSDPMITVRATDDFTEVSVARTTVECPCLSHWVDWLNMGRDPTFGSSLDDYAFEAYEMAPHELCSSSPRVLRQNANGQEAMPQFLEVNCSVTNYCSSSDTPMCYINTTGKKHGSDCFRTPWSFCPEEAFPEITFKNVSLTSILGHEQRRNNRCTAKKQHILLDPCTTADCQKLSDIMISWDERQITKKFYCSNDVFVYPFTMLLGFQEPTFVQQQSPWGWTEPMRPSNCSIPCCGLQNKTDSVGSYCAINSEADYTDVFLQYVHMLNDTEPNVTGLVDGSANQMKANAVAKEWYGIVLVWSSLKTQGSGPTAQSECEQACRLDAECKAYVYRQGSVNDGYACTTYSETWPYQLFIYNRSETPPAWILSPKSVYSRLFNFEASTGSDSDGINNAYVNTLPHTNAQPTGYISGPNRAKALDFNACAKLCEQHGNCTSIAYPGCYLFNYTPSYWESIEQKAGDPRNTTVFIKEHVSVKVSGVTGSPSVKAYSDDTTDNFEAIPALVNRPSACALDSSGNVLIADTWNHRVRKISKLHVGCQYNMDLFTKDDVREYRDAINNMEELCFGRPCESGSVGCRDAPFHSTAQTMQYDLLQNLKQSSVDALCNADQAVVAEGINTKNLQVLCDVCSTKIANHPWTATCPADDKCCQLRDKCNCRNSIVRVLASKVYLNCPDKSAYYEKWHKFVTAYAACWMLASQKDTMFLGNNSASRSILAKELVATP